MGPSSSRGRDAAWVVLDRTATRLLTFARGDMVYLKTPSDPNVRGCEGWYRGGLGHRRGLDEVQKDPEGHCGLEHVVETRGSGRETWRTGTTGTKWRGTADAKAGTRGAGDRDGDGNADGTAMRTQTTSTSSRWRCSARAGGALAAQSVRTRGAGGPPGRVLMRDDGTREDAVAVDSVEMTYLDRGKQRVGELRFVTS